MQMCAIYITALAVGQSYTLKNIANIVLVYNRLLLVLYLFLELIMILHLMMRLQQALTAQ